MPKKPAIFTPEGTPVPTKKVPEIKAIHPSGSSILVEMLNADELLNTNLYVGDKTEAGPPQAYVVELGPALKSRIDEGEKIFLNEGDRVIVQGTYVPIPNWDDHSRERGLLEFHNIKAIVEEK